MPKKIGRFEIVSQVTQSSFATVYKALDPETQQTLALKVAALNNLPDRDDLAKAVFEEADRSKPLNSHNIASLYGVGDEDGLLLAGSEYVQGNSVATTLARKDGFSIWDLQDIARQVCHALDHAQVHKVVHHSLEPAKIMVQWDGMVKVLGFGISSMNGLASTSSSIVPEILHYISPEQLRGEACDHRSALFGLGAILYEMATERKAFAGQTAEQIRAAILETVPPLPHRLKPNLTPSLSALIMKAISKSPDNRFQSGQELVRALEQCNASASPVAPSAPARPKVQAASASVGVGVTAKPGVSPKPNPVANVLPKPVAQVLPKPVASAAPAAAKPPAKPSCSVGALVAVVADGDDSSPSVGSKLSFSELAELPPLKEIFVPSISPKPAPEEAEPAEPLQTDTKKKPAAEKPQIPFREVAQMAVAEMRKLPPKLYVYGVGGAVLLIAIIVSGMAFRNYLRDHDSQDKDSGRPSAAAAPVQTAPAKRIAPSAPVNPVSAAPNPAPTQADTPVQAEIAPPAPMEPKPTLTIEEQPEPPATSRNQAKKHAAARVAQLTVSSVPAGAQIAFDGSPLCQSPCTLTDIAPGKHVVSASKAGFTSQSRTIALRPGTSSVALQLNSVATTVTLMVSSNPAGGAIVIDGRDTGRFTPTLFSFDKPGAHTVVVRRSGFLEETSTANVQTGQAASVNLSLKRLGSTDEIRGAGGKFKKVFARGGGGSSMGVVSIKTQPKGAQIMVNQRVLDKTAPYDFYLNPGTYEIDITMSGYRTLHRVINVEEGEKVAIQETLSPQ
jgi:serine/threonine protein kinase